MWSHELLELTMHSVFRLLHQKEARNKMFDLMIHSVHFVYGCIVLDVQYQDFKKKIHVYFR